MKDLVWTIIGRWSRKLEYVVVIGYSWRLGFRRWTRRHIYHVKPWKAARWPNGDKPEISSPLYAHWLRGYDSSRVKESLVFVKGWGFITEGDVTAASPKLKAKIKALLDAFDAVAIRGLDLGREPRVDLETLLLGTPEERQAGRLTIQLLIAAAPLKEPTSPEDLAKVATWIVNEESDLSSS